MGGVTGLAVDKDDNVWVHDRPNDTLDIEGHFGLNPPTADCCVRPPSMIHIDKNGNVIGSFDAPQGHGMDVDSAGFIYLGNAVDGVNTVHKYDSKTGQLVKSVPHAPENQPGGNDPAAQAAFRAKYPPTTPMIVGGLEEIRLDEGARELYAADNYLGGRVMVFDMDTFAFKRGWGAYGHPLAQMTTDAADRAYTPGGPMPKEFRGHLTFNFSNDGKVYAADRNANRIDVTDKQGKYLGQEIIIAPMTGAGGSTGGVGMSADKGQKYLYISDLTNNTIWFLNRADGKILGRLGSMGDMGGQFYGLHMIAVDSRNNIYTGEVQNGERVQRFVPVK
jgi:DNA-binding beta-propeller fold protein YncE